MPRSRKRPGHHKHHESSVIPAKQRVKGRIVWGILFSVFGLIFSFFSTSADDTSLIIGAVVGFLVGYFIGLKMEKDAQK